MSRTISWILVALAVLFSCCMAFQETMTMINGPEPEVKSQGPTVSLTAEAPEGMLSATQESDAERREFTRRLADRFGLPLSSISMGAAVGGTDARIRIACKPEQREEIDKCLNDLQYPMRALEIKEVTLTGPDHKVIEVNAVEPDMLGYPLSRDIVMYEMVRGWCKPLADAILHSAIDHTNKAIKGSLFDPVPVAYRFALDKMLSASTEIDCQDLAAIERNTSIEDPEQSSIAGKFEDVLCGTAGSGMSADEQAQFIRDHVHPDVTQSYLLKSVYDNNNQPEKAAAALKENARVRKEVEHAINIDLITFVLTAIACLVYVFDRKKFFQLPDLETSVACPLAYGWIKPFLIATFAICFAIFGFLFIFVIAPGQMDESQALMLAYFRPLQTAMMGNYEESILVLPAAMAAYALVGYKESIVDFVRLHFKTAKYKFRDLFKVSLECVVLSWTPAMVATLLSYWFHFPWEKASTVSTELLIASRSMPALCVLTLGYAFCAPIIEEVAFRGILHPALRRRFAVLPSIIIGAVIFSTIHMEFTPWWLVDKFIFAAVNAYALEKTGSIVPGIINHMITNALVILFMVASLA